MDRRTTPTQLKPCPECGSPCRVEVFGPNDSALPEPVTIWVCSSQRLFGGTCLSDAYLTEKAWNQRTTQEEAQPMTELVERQDAIEALRSAFHRVQQGKAGKPMREGPLKLMWDVINAVPAALYHLDGTQQFEADLAAEELTDAIEAQAKRIAELEGALEPFSAHADPRGNVPAEMRITQGSALAKRQLVMGDCYRARTALGRGR